MATRLGRGLDVLLPQKGEGLRQPAAIPEIPVDAIAASPHQVRTVFHQADLQTLADSIKAFGVLEPILVSQRPAGGYVLVAGERRLRAARLAGLKTIPAIIKNLGSKESVLVGLIENVQRKDLNPIELAKGLNKMMDDFKLTHEEVASSVGFSRPRVSNLLRLLNLEPEIQEYIVLGHIHEGQARALLSLDSETDRLRIAKEIAEGHRSWSVREIEHKKKIRRKDPNIAVQEEELAKHLGTRVKISLSAKKKSGWISVYFGNLEHFDSLHRRLKAERS
ncbi:MAG: ParB/RepB/Spo0J family partition protein [Elusimicrobia bacterium]|nr:ParB/RepB/Spo0J family partition protein [Elusimicrobiota bacterium]